MTPTSAMGTTNLRTMGFEIIPQVLNPEECDRWISRLSQKDVPRSRAGARHLLSLPDVASLARESRLMNIARKALACEPLPFRATLFEKSQDANWLVVWHQDTALPMVRRFEETGWGPWSVKAGVHYVHAPAGALSRIIALRLHFDESTAENGPLRVVHGSHRLGVLSDEELLRLTQSTPAVECLVPKGAVLAMFPLIAHASSKSKGRAARRVLHIEYADSDVLGDWIRLAVA